MSDSFLYPMSSFCDSDNRLLPQFQLNVKFLSLAIWRSTKMNIQCLAMKSTLAKHPFSYGVHLKKLGLGLPWWSSG